MASVKITSEQGEEISLYEYYTNPETGEEFKESALGLVSLVFPEEDRIAFPERVNAEVWRADNNFPANAINRDQVILRVDGGLIPDANKGAVFVFNPQPIDGEAVDVFGLIGEYIKTRDLKDIQRARQAALLTYTPNNKGEIIERFGFETQDRSGKSEPFAMIAVSKDPLTGEITRVTDATALNWINPITDPDLVILEEDGKSHFYMLESVKDGDGKDQQDVIYFDGLPLPDLPEEAQGLKYYGQILMNGSLVFLSEVSQQGVVNRFQLFHEPGGEARWVALRETIFKKEEFEPLIEVPWHDGTLGFKFYVNTDPPDVAEHNVYFIGRVKEIYVERKWNPIQRKFDELYWARMIYDEEGQNTVDILAFTSNEWPDNSWYKEKGVLISPNGEPYFRPRGKPANQFIYENGEILDALKKSSFIRIGLSIFREDEDGKEGLRFYGSDEKWLYDPNHLARLAYLQYHYGKEQMGFIKHLIGDLPESKIKQYRMEQLVDELKGFSEKPDGVRFGGELVIVTPAP